MENVIEIRLNLDRQSESAFAGRGSARVKATERMSILDWYRMLRAHHHWTVFQAIRFALWLAR